MKLDIDNATLRKAKVPHNIFMLNLALVHLLMTPAVIALDIGIAGMLMPLSLSLLIILFTYLKYKQAKDHQHPFIYAHWKLAIKRYRLLLISYAVTAALMALGWLIAAGSPDPHMQNILHTVLLRIAIMPVLLIVMVNFYLESSAISMVSNKEMPN